MIGYSQQSKLPCSTVKHYTHAIFDWAKYWVKKIHSYIWKVTGLEKREDFKSAHFFSSKLAQLERIPVGFNSGSLTCKNYKDFQDYIQQANIIVQRMNKYVTKKPSKANNVSCQLKSQIIGLKYRIRKDSEKSAPLESYDGSLLKAITLKAATFKSKQWQLQNKELTDEDLDGLKTISRYPEFIKLLSENPSLETPFFKWAIRDKCSVEPFILFPDVCRRLTDIYINKRIGFFKDLLKVQKEETDEGYQKILTLKFEGKDVSILDENKSINLKHGYSPTIKAVFEAFKFKNFSTGDFECFQDGVKNFNVEHLGSWDKNKKVYTQVDLDQNEWWKNLSPFKNLNNDEVKARYGQDIKVGEYAVVAMGSRETPDLNIVNTHGWLEIVIPLDDGTFSIYPFGKLADRFPKNTWETVKILADTRPAKIMYPDMNVFYTHRQKAGKMFKLTDSKFRILMNVIKRDIQKSRDKRIVFQFLSDNCASWVQKVMDRTFGKNNVPRLYTVPIEKPESKGFLGAISYPFKVIKSPFIKGLYMSSLFRTLGAWRKHSVGKGINKRTWSVTTSHFWKKRESFIPAYLVACNC